MVTIGELKGESTIRLPWLLLHLSAPAGNGRTEEKNPLFFLLDPVAVVDAPLSRAAVGVDLALSVRETSARPSLSVCASMICDGAPVGAGGGNPCRCRKP